MNNTEAKSILVAELSNYRKRAYKELLLLANESQTIERVSETGKKYQIQIEIFVDDEAFQNLRVVAAIDDGGWRWLIPLTDDFIVAPDGSFIGE